ncbi:MAG: efflux transporter periplasmic adaptor subunit [Legionellales bacterium RIFCSPHIGHO2_12_FULL_35_11]|nr:MAG: efflux transporter periplasmic adaptor subunit [Legionellales bacterium RIFCSPHIGHO2_12_FULL_35_11]
MNIDKKIEITKKALFGIIGLVILSMLIKSCFHGKEAEVPFPNVIIDNPKIKKITEYVTQTGTMVAYQSVDLVARVEGFLEKIDFIDGTFVKKGKELFIIEPKPYLEKKIAAEADVSGKEASYNYSQIEYDRQKRMYTQKATSLNNVQSWEAREAEANARVGESIANSEIAKINYSYTKVFAPFDGRIGRHLVDTGNLVGNGVATNLATIEQIDPIYAYFNLNELDLIKIREIARKKNFNPDNVSEIPVQVKMQNEKKFMHKGHLNFVNTGLNASTGTLEFRALLPNPDNYLLPGFFVQVRIPLSDPIERLVIPNTAILYDQIGAYVYTVDKNNLVIQARVTLGSKSGRMRVILDGLTKDDNLIVSGIHNATPGRQVTPIKYEAKTK